MHVWHMGVFKIFWNKAVFGCRKTFSGKYIFFGNANFRKRKIFPCVWLHFKKFFGKYFLVFGKEEGKHNPEKTQTQFKFFLLDLSPARSRKGEIAINGAILSSRDRDRRIFLSDLAIFLDRSSSRISRWHDLAKARLRPTARSRSSLLLSRAHAFSLSPIFRKCFEGKIEV